MPLLSDWEDTNLKAELEDEFRDSCVIYSTTEGSQDAYLGTTDTEAATNSTSCSYRFLSGDEIAELQAASIRANVEVHLPALTTVTENGRAVVTDNDTGETFNVNVTWVGHQSGELARKFVGIAQRTGA